MKVKKYSNTRDVIYGRPLTCKVDKLEQAESSLWPAFQYPTFKFKFTATLSKKLDHTFIYLNLWKALAFWKSCRSGWNWHLIASSGVVAETVQSHLLLGHQLAGALVHLGVVYPDPAEDGERLEQDDVRFTEGCPVFLTSKNKNMIFFVYKKQCLGVINIWRQAIWGWASRILWRLNFKL